MSTREVAAIALKMLSIWLVLELFLAVILVTLPNVGLIQQANELHFQAIVTVVLILVGLALALLLWRLGNSVLNSTSSSLAPAGHFETLAIQLFGLYLIVINLGEPTVFLSLALTKGRELSVYEYARLFATMIELGVGLSLFVKPYFWKKALGKYRNE